MFSLRGTAIQSACNDVVMNGHVKCYKLENICIDIIVAKDGYGIANDNISRIITNHGNQIISKVEK